MPTLSERWGRGIPHDPRSIELYRAIAELDFNEGTDFFCFKAGGDGDNGEHLMYLLDTYFEALDQKRPKFVNLIARVRERAGLTDLRNAPRNAQLDFIVFITLEELGKRLNTEGVVCDIPPDVK